MVAPAEGPKDEPSQILSLRKGRRSKVKIPFAPECIVKEVVNGVTVYRLSLDMKAEWIDGRPIVRLYLPEGGNIENPKKPKAD